MVVIQHRQTYKFAFKNKLQQLLHLSSAILVMKWHKIQVQEVKSIKQTYPVLCLQFLLLSAYAFHKLVLPGHCTHYFCDHTLKHHCYIICPEKAMHEMLCLWHSPNTFTWCTKYTTSTFTILFTFTVTFFMSFSLTWRQDFHIRW